MTTSHRVFQEKNLRRSIGKPERNCLGAVSNSLPFGLRSLEVSRWLTDARQSSEEVVITKTVLWFEINDELGTKGVMLREMQIRIPLCWGSRTSAMGREYTPRKTGERYMQCLVHTDPKLYRITKRYSSETWSCSSGSLV